MTSSAAGNVAELSQVGNKWVAKYRGQVLAASPRKDYVIDGIRAGRCTKANAFNVKDVRELGEMVVKENGQSVVLQATDKFTIDERFNFLSDFVVMVAEKTAKSLIVSGEGGLGKTFTVNETIQKAGYKDMSEVLANATSSSSEALDISGQKTYVVVKGYSTAKGLYRTLFENRNRITIFDDCDSILRDPVALNILKSALDSYDKRIISWNAESFGDDDLPRSFEFKGGVIFISNLPLFKLDGAVKSRAFKVDLSMNTEQKLERMETISKLPSFLPEYTKEQKHAALKFLRKMKDTVPELNMRTLISVVMVALKDSNWERRAEYLITAG